jgi:hypothetical protein
VLTTPVALAAGPGGGASAPVADTRRPPDPETDPAMRAARLQELQRQRDAAERRDRPGARDARKASRNSYKHLDRTDAVELAQAAFPELRQRAYRALELAPGERVAQWIGDRAARIDQGAGKPDLFLESELPLRTLNGSGAATPVDLSLRGSAAQGFTPLAPLVDLTIDGRAPGGLALRDIDLAVKPVGSADALGVARQDKAFFAEAHPDTDLVVTPLPAGVDLGAQLRSPESPETYRWRLDPPPGAALRANAEGGAEIAGADGSSRAQITAPVAWDADDHAVKTALAVRGDELVVSVEHRGQDVRYPILLDPTILEDKSSWYANSGIDLSGWMWTNPSGRFSYFYGSAYLGNGLYTYSRGAKQFTAGDYANWYFNAPGTSRIVRADFGFVKHEPQTTGTYAAPYNDDRVYEGVWSYTNNRYETGTWCEPAEAGGACGRSPFTSYGALNYNSKSHTNLEGTPGNSAIFGTAVYYAGVHGDFTNFLGSASVFIQDDAAPSLSDDSGLSDGSWTTFRAFQGRATDTGLGLRSLVMDSPAAPDWSGRYTYTAGCTGDRKSRCPQSAFAFSDTSGLPEGVVPVRFTATDVVGNTATRTWRLRIDRSAPAIQAPADESHEVDAAQDTAYTTTVTARDGDAENLRSGVRSIDFALLDESGQTELQSSRDPEPQDCPDGSCAKTRSWTVPLDTMPDGTYTVRVTATDQLGITATQTWPLVVNRGVPPETE